MWRSWTRASTPRRALGRRSQILLAIRSWMGVRWFRRCRQWLHVVAESRHNSNLNGCKVIWRDWWCSRFVKKTEVYLNLIFIKVPTGSGVKDNNKKTDLLYNEYIVYDVAQVVVEHLLLQGFESWLRIYSGSSEIPPADEVQLQDLNEPKAFFTVVPLSFFKTRCKNELFPWHSSQQHASSRETPCLKTQFAPNNM